MPFLRTENIDVPTKDFLSWYFDDPVYDLNRPIYTDALKPSSYYTANQARTAIRQLIAGFHAAGLAKGEVVCLHAFNHIHYPVIVNAVVGTGGIFAGTNPSYTAFELSHAISTAKVSWFIVEPELLPKVVEACGENKLSKDRVFVFDHDNNSGEVPSGFRSWRWLLQHGERDWIRFDSKQISKDTIAARLFSSGTTGLPKAAELSAYNLKAQHVQAHEWKPRPYQIRRLSYLPFFHVSTVPLMHFSALRNGTQHYIMRRFELEPFLAAIERFAITDIMLVPPVANAMVNSDLTSKYSLKSIRSGLGGGAPIGKDLQAKVQALLPPEGRFCQLWAMTELSCIATTFFYPDRDDTGSVGWPVPGLDFKLVDENGNEITGYDRPGEMCVRGESVIRGYLDNPAANKDWDSEGFFHTGDIMYCDGQSKKWYIVDRSKELIKVRAFQVAPSELEAVLLTHPLIADAAVIGIKKATGESEMPRAYIVRQKSAEAQTLTESAIKEFMAGKLARYKQLDGGVLFVSEIAKNPSGKILKRILREQAAAETKAKL